MITGFAPISDSRSRILILGSMPSEASLTKNQYYGHPRNAFWPLMCELFGETCYEDYAERTDMLLRHGVALWDVVAECERTGSSDAAIKNVKANDFIVFFDAHPLVKHVFFNGEKAYALFIRHAGLIHADVKYERLGSTSPAHAIPFDRRKADWQKILPYLESL